MPWSYHDRLNGVGADKHHHYMRGGSNTAQPLPPSVITEQRNQAPVSEHIPLQKGKNTSLLQDQYELHKYGYGKNHVKLLHVQREGATHSVREYEVSTHLRLHSQRDYLEGNNQDIIATDTQKNTVYVLAKKYGVESPEDFALLICSHFLYTYRHVDEASVHVEEFPWERLQAEDRPHSHAFLFSPSAFRFCTVKQRRNEKPRVTGGLRELRVLKTTQSAFTDFIQDDYRTLPDANDRIFSTIVTASWEFSCVNNVDFDGVWDAVKECILENFAGPPETGVISKSVQNTLYLTEKTVLDKVKQVFRIEMWMPNKHYFSIDLSKFPASVVQGENKEVYMPVDKPSGIIHAMLERKQTVSKL